MINLGMPCLPQAHAISKDFEAPLDPGEAGRLGKHAMVIGPSPLQLLSDEVDSGPMLYDLQAVALLHQVAHDLRDRRKRKLVIDEPVLRTVEEQIANVPVGIVGELVPCGSRSRYRVVAEIFPGEFLGTRTVQMLSTAVIWKLVSAAIAEEVV